MLIKKMIRDIRSHKTQFISIFLMSFLALLIFSGLGSEYTGYKKVLDEYYKETNFADIWLYSSNFTKEDEKMVNNIADVTGVARRISIESSSTLEGNPKITLLFNEQDNISKAYAIDGENFNLDDSGGIWLDKDFADKRGLHVGDSFSVSYSGYTLEKIIKGIIISPEYVYMENDQMMPDHNSMGFAYLSYKAFPKEFCLSDGSVPFTEMLVTVKSGTNKTTLENKLYELLKQDKSSLSGGLSIFQTRDENVSNSVFKNEIEERKSMTVIFPIAFLAISLLTILTTMTRIVRKQRPEIGVLKALGFQKSKITLHYVSYGFFLTLLGGLLGAVLGPIALPPLFYDAMKTTYTLPYWESAFYKASAYVLVFTVLSSTLITFLSCRKILRESASSALRPQSPKISKLNILETSKFWSRRSFSWQWNFRDVFRNKIRSIMAVTGVIGCMGLLITAFGCMDAFRGIIDMKFDSIEKYECIYNLDENITENEISNIIEKTSGQALMSSAVEIKYEANKESSTLTVNDNVTLHHYLNMKWNKSDLPEDGIALSYKLADKLNVSVGDTIKWHMYGENIYIESKISKIYRDPTEQGMVMSRNTFENYGLTFKATSILSESDKINNLAGVANVTSISESKSNLNDMLSTMYTLVGILCVAAILLAVVVLYNLGVLSYSEKEKELATLKVLGIQSNKIRQILLVQNIWLSLIGLIPGYFFGSLMLKSIMSSMGNEFDIYINISLLSIIICTSITMVVSVVVNYLLSGKVRKLDMVSSLKGIE